MSGDEGVKVWEKLFGRRAAPSPAEAWQARRNEAPPEEVITVHFAAMVAHDLDWILSTLTPERAKLYQDARTVDKRRLSLEEARVLSMTRVDPPFPLPMLEKRYRSVYCYRVHYELKLAPQEKRRDPTLKEGVQWSYYIVVTEGRRKPWLIADWGR